MSPDSNLNRVLLVVGPTGVGKTGLSIDLARKIDGEIISADSRYLYRGMDIGTAKPSLDERKSVPHHLIDVADPDETWSLALFIERTHKLIDQIQSRNKVPIIVGGTGQYMRAITEGWRIPAFEPASNLRRVLTEWSEAIGRDELHKKLTLLDDEAARFIDASNVRRTIRALEVILSTGVKFSSLRIKEGPAHNYWIIGLTMERRELYERVDARIESMFKRGFVEEVRRLLELGYGPAFPSMSGIGYREVIRYLNDEIDLETAKGLMRRGTRQFIRRQTNWFKPADPDIHWFSMDPYPLATILEDLNRNTKEHH